MLAWASCEGRRPPQGGDALRPWPSGAHRRWRNPGDAADRARHMGPQGSPGGQRGGGAERRGRPGCVTSTATGLDVQRAPGHSGHLGTTAIWVQRASGHHSHLGIVGIWAQQPSGRSGHLGTTACRAAQAAVPRVCPAGRLLSPPCVPAALHQTARSKRASRCPRCSQQLSRVPAPDAMVRLRLGSLITRKRG